MRIKTGAFGQSGMISRGDKSRGGRSKAGKEKGTKNEMGEERKEGEGR